MTQWSPQIQIPGWFVKDTTILKPRRGLRSTKNSPRDTHSRGQGSLQGMFSCAESFNLCLPQKNRPWVWNIVWPRAKKPTQPAGFLTSCGNISPYFRLIVYSFVLLKCLCPQAWPQLLVFQTPWRRDQGSSAVAQEDFIKANCTCCPDTHCWSWSCAVSSSREQKCLLQGWTLLCLPWKLWDQDWVGRSVWTCISDIVMIFATLHVFWALSFYW